ncbi:MAG: phosphonoacetate hydrolase [Rhodospirillaceae bacterium TMED8]|nr:phosphonoacetate hydrolase [Magnetovibrio sp.]OUT50068.1 MAG: phosphonoacetate hydrolase [Rhodospirillaceae bacterium TMED8]|tara:strand:- start:1717 stop:2955 length:1239 start_codon:yes stop_codon:yes gene_type:complete
MRNLISVNGRNYAWPAQPLVVTCIDGSEPDYIEQAITGGHMPFLAKALKNGTNLLADCVIPSFTNPNNLSIVTGVPPAVHGISGNFFLNPETGEEVMMNDPEFLRSDSIFKAFHDSGAKIAVVTAKDKLRRLLGHGLNFSTGRAICFSSEKANETTLAKNGIDNAQKMVGCDLPSIYSAELSEFVFSASVKLMKSFKPHLMYLSTTDYIQHKHAPGTPVANAFYSMMDSYWRQLDAEGAVLAMTADHGMSAKFTSAGEPDVIYLQKILDDAYGDESTRVILPITDPYVVHHGALGSFATIYLPETIAVAQVVETLSSVKGIEKVYTNKEGCEEFELPTDRMGNLIVISEQNKVLGTSPDRHDLSQLNEPLRSHGGLSEQCVPLIITRALALPTNNRPRNFDIFDIALNHAVS